MHASEKWKGSRSVVSDPQWPHGLQPTRLLRPWDFPGKSTGLGCHCLLHQCSLVGRNSGCLLDSPGGTSLVVHWLGLYASTVDGGGGVTRVCSLIWELVSHTLLSVVKENRITWGTLKNSHSPQQQQQKMLSSSPRNVNDICLSAGPRIFFFSRSPSDSNGQPETGNISFWVSLQQSWRCCLNACLLQWGHSEDPE